jgi:hypothetical protein
MRCWCREYEEELLIMALIIRNRIYFKDINQCNLLLFKFNDIIGFKDEK